MPRIEIYTRPGCGYCTHAKRLLHNLGLAFIEYDVYQYPEHIAQLHSKTFARTYPQVFIEGEAVGGFTELLAAQQNGLLAQLLDPKINN
ncbi:MAG: glutaredoxin domain-containing protein [Oceanospirillaceae bacterium]